MDALWLYILIALGLVLIIVEIAFVPGTTVVGFMGGAVMIGGVLLVYKYVGNTEGLWSLIITSVSVVALIIIAVKTKAWKRLSLEDELMGRAELVGFDKLTEGQEGLAISGLRPSGEAEFDENRFEVRTEGELLAPGTKVRIKRIDDGVIFVAPIS